ncbi:unnamed protein product [Sphagnum troendelagicum]|uniref:Uncharacterized protein n=1 Tax=Sphagnum troendelagicum TaxID=128251 RepID=A0ABP0UVW5_9BRYO
MGQSLSSMFSGLNLRGVFGPRVTAEEVARGVDLSNRTVIVTGATSGIGRETARVLAMHGAHVVIAARKMESGLALKETILTESPKATVDVMHIDLASLKSVKSFAEEYKAKNLGLDILINNAGVFMKQFVASDEGIEYMFTVHDLGHYYLTVLLLDTIKKTAKASGNEGRIVFTASEGHRITYKEGINFHSLTDPALFNPYKAYGQSKLGDILLAKEFAEILKEEGAPVTSNAVHPGAVTTKLGRNFFNHAITDVGYEVSQPFLRSPEEGAATIVYVATCPGLKGETGKYFADCAEKQPSNHGCNKELRKKLWKWCEDFVAARLGTYSEQK